MEVKTKFFKEVGIYFLWGGVGSRVAEAASRVVGKHSRQHDRNDYNHLCRAAIRPAAFTFPRRKVVRQDADRALGGACCICQEGASEGGRNGGIAGRTGVRRHMYNQRPHLCVKGIFNAEM